MSLIQLIGGSIGPQIQMHIAIIGIHNHRSKSVGGIVTCPLTLLVPNLPLKLDNLLYRGLTGVIRVALFMGWLIPIEED